METFGISSKTIPLNPVTGEVSVTSLQRWIEKRLVAEGSTSKTSRRILGHSIVLEPTDSDVIFGRGKGIQIHPGNVRLRKLIDSTRPKYEGAKLSEKTSIADQLVQHIKGSGGSFLKKGDGDGWIEVADETAREKISHAFRDSRRKVKQQEN
jgi:hypothetical protein